MHDFTELPSCSKAPQGHPPHTAACTPRMLSRGWPWSSHLCQPALPRCQVYCTRHRISGRSREFLPVCSLSSSTWNLFPPIQVFSSFGASQSGLIIPIDNSLPGPILAPSCSVLSLLRASLNHTLKETPCIPQDPPLHPGYPAHEQTKAGARE